MQKTDVKQPLVKCAVCGKGHVPLSEKLSEVLDVIKEKPASVLEIFTTLKERGSPVKRTAINNRVVMLEDFHLVSCHKKAKAWIYTAIQ